MAPGASSEPTYPWGRAANWTPDAGPGATNAGKGKKVKGERRAPKPKPKGGIVAKKVPEADVSELGVAALLWLPVAGVASIGVTPVAKDSKKEVKRKEEGKRKGGTAAPKKTQTPAIEGLEGLPETVPSYFQDTYLFQSNASVLCVVGGEAGGAVVVTDRTIFHPQGGGQPSDTGRMTCGASIFKVEKVVKSGPGGVILHYGTFEGSTLTNGAEVLQEIDMQSRKLHARIHSAGHLLDVAMEKIGQTLKPSKGYHFPKGAYVEYIGKIDIKQRDQIIKDLQEAVEGLITADIPTLVRMENSVRTVYVASEKHNQGCPCGGTHVKRSGEIGVMKISKIKNSKGNARVSYALA